MMNKTKKIPTKEELILKKRAMEPDEEKYKEFFSQNLERVLQFLESEEIEDKIRKYLKEESSQLASPHEGDLSLEERVPYLRIVTDQGDFPPDDILEAFIQRWIRDFADDLCYLLFIALSDPKERVKFSGAVLEYRKGLCNAYLQRLGIILDDPSFVEYMEFDRESLSAKHHGLLKDLEHTTHREDGRKKRAGQRKFLEFPLFPVVGKFTLLGYKTPYSRAKFLFNLFKKFDVPLLYDKTKEQVIGEISKWESVKYLD